MMKVLMKKTTLIAGLLGALALVVLAVVYWTRKPATVAEFPEPHGPFRECARESGITFRMKFLPEEQGEKFKINLYDHGCGVAIGDYNGDGLDDIYFVNQLGPNALFRNKGDGTFEDVTAQANVALGDRICVAATFADTRNN